MQNTMMKTILAMGVALALSACGSSGDDSKPSTQSSNTTQNNGSSSNGGSLGTTETNNSGSSVVSTNTAWNKNLTLNENAQLFAKENKYLVKPPTTELQKQLDIALTNTNKLRAEKGLSALKYDAKLAAVAQRRAEEIVGRFSHSLPDSNSSYSTYISKGGSGENIAAGKTTGEATIEQWRNSPGHYANMTKNDYTKIGIGVVAVPGSKYGYYWVQIFGFDDTDTNYVFDSSIKSNLSDVTAPMNTTYTDKYNWLNLDGNVSLYLGAPKSKGSWENFDKNGYSGIINGYDNVRFGTIKQGSGSVKVFYTGNNTVYENEDSSVVYMPQSGSAQYVGKAVIVHDNKVNNNLDAQFQADFGNKKLTGVLSENGNRVVDINAHIRGTTFHSPQNAPVETQGSFFGEKATELGGVFHENATGKYGAFGAKR